MTRPMNRPRTRPGTRRTAAIALAALLLSGAPAHLAWACTGALTAEEILGCLNPKPRTRGLRAPTRGITIDGQAEAEPQSVNLMVNFEFNSARLGNDGMISLDALGRALSDPSLANQRFRIAGHTDGVGSDVYNLRLSEARAGAVRAYLVQHFRLDQAAFDVIGFGKSQLVNGQDPAAAENRRVQVTKLGG